MYVCLKSWAPNEGRKVQAKSVSQNFTPERITVPDLFTTCIGFIVGEEKLLLHSLTKMTTVLHTLTGMLHDTPEQSDHGCVKECGIHSS